MEKMIFLIRHAEPIRSDDQKRFLGQSDPDLSPDGIDQAEQVAHALRKENIRTVFTSDLQRAEHTAVLIAEKHLCKVMRVNAFREINMGEWEGRRFQEIQERCPDEYDRRGRDLANFQPPGGESFSDLQRRVLSKFAEVVKNTEGNLAIVAHAGVNRVILCQLLALPLQELFTIKQHYAAINILCENAGNFRVLDINRTSVNLAIAYHS